MINILERKYINLLLGFGIILMMALISLAFIQISKLNNMNKWVVHSHQVIEETDEVLVNINYVESMVRAYFIFNDKDQISHLNTAIDSLHHHLSKLTNLTKDNLKQRPYVKLLTESVNWRINDLNEKIKIYNKGGIKKLIQLPKTGALVSDEIRTVINQVITNEGGLLRDRSQTVEKQYILINTLITICGLFSLLFISFGIVQLNQQIRFRNRTENKLKKSENELYKLAYYDSLTGLANRAMVHSSIEALISSTENKNDLIAILFIDLDSFKNINDSLGHEVGDSLLKAYANRLLTIFGDESIIARLGGDEFVILLSNLTSQDEVWNIAQNALYELTLPFNIHTHKIYVTSSIGISMFPDNGNSSHELLKNADIALYKAKELGKNNIQFCMPELTKYAKERALLDYELHHALSNNEFYLLYQPIISLKDYSVVSVEVLIRWNRPNVGVILPSNFIKLAESNGLIMPIGDWMLKIACTEAKKWTKHYNKRPIKMAVNVSTRQFILADFASRIDQILRDTDFDPNLLELEITESVLFENSHTNLATLNTLKEMGVKISIDDFGTGYSSLSYLRLFAIDKLKIDQSFIHEVNPDNYTSRIIKSIIAMAHDLNIKVLAEGVEAQEQLNFLKQHNCDEAQGYYYSQPLTAAEFLAFLEKQHIIKQP